MAVQFSLSYDANGDPVLVENTVAGTRKVVSTSPVVSEYKSRFETPASEDTNTDTDTDTSDGGSDIYRYINEMENNADNDMNLSFVEKQNLQTYTPEAIEARDKPKTRTQQVMETIALAMIPYADAAVGVMKALGKILPQESEEIKAIKQFYADPEMSTLVESIPGMSNYNLVYGNPFNPSYGLADAADKRTATMAKTLANKYGMTAAEIEMAKVGTYTGDVDSDLIKRIKKTTDLSREERKQQDDFNRKKSQDIQTPNQDLVDNRFTGGGAERDPPTSSAPDRQTPNQDQDRFDGGQDARGGGQDLGGTTDASGTEGEDQDRFG